ncbi:MAG: D-alanyl-D-alanine carboxypeptidase family protein [Gemmiger sp.]
MIAFLFSLLLGLCNTTAAVAEQATPESASQAGEIQPATTADFDVPCKAAILVDEDSGTVLYEKNADEQRPIASITKVMTLLLAFEALEAGKVQLTDVVPVSEHAYGMGGSQIWLEPGEQLTLEEMFKAICISSANDAAVAVAEFISGSEPAFVQEMNRKAEELGMSNTHFENACGLDATGHLSTARDVAVMSREMLLYHPEVEDYCMIWMDSLRNGQTQLVNTNKLLKSYNGITGLKTGTTGGAGVCISASASRDGLSLIAVVLGAASGKERFEAATALLDYGFANYANLKVELPQDAPATLPVKNGVEQTVTLEYTTPAGYLVEKGQAGAIQVQLKLPESVEAEITAGQQLGEVQILRGGAVIDCYPVTAGNDVAKLNFVFCFRRLAEALLLNAQDFVQEK